MPDTPTNTNTASNVSVGKPKVTGAIYTAPLGTALPTDAVTDLAGAYIGLGYVSEDGVTNENKAETKDIKAWGGDTVSSEQTSKTDKFKYKLIEALNVEVLKAVYRSDNVSGTLSTGITVHANSKPSTAAVWVIDIVMTDNAVKRVVIPEGKLTELEEIVYKDDDAIGYGMTISARPSSSANGDTHIEYIKRAS